MNHEKRFSVRRGLQGCLATYAVLVILFVWLLLVNSFGTSLFISYDMLPVVHSFGWLFAVYAGGYVAARLGKITGWTNSLVVGLLAEVYVYGYLRRDDQTFSAPLLEIIDDPATHWGQFVVLALTIPLAIMGGVIWQTTGGSPSSDKKLSEAAKKSKRSGE